MTTRREFVLAGAAGLFAGCREFGSAGSGSAPAVRFGIVTDLHYADIDPDPAPVGVVGRRFYRESRRKLAEAVAVFNARQLDFAIELGDFKDDTHGREGTLRHLEAIEAEFARFRGPRYHVAGNHDFDCLEPDEFFSRIPNDGTPCMRGYYSFVRGGVTFVVLNACFDSSMRPYSRSNPWDDANVPPAELEWLERELSAAPGKVVVFCHQRIDGSSDPQHLVRNAAGVRAVLERSGKVVCVITGHQHKGGGTIHNGIPYYSLRALVCDSGEGANSFAEVAVYPSGAFTVTGWRNAVSRGARGEFPERGLAARPGDSESFPGDAAAAFAAAVRKGAEMVELSVVRCRTGELAVMRGSAAGASGCADGMSLAELRACAGERVLTLEEALSCFPRTGVLLYIRCMTGDAGRQAAAVLRGTGRLAQGVLVFDRRDILEAFKKSCLWTKTGLALHRSAGPRERWPESDTWAMLRDAAGIGVEFIQVAAPCRCTAAQLAFLRDRGIRTAYFLANDAGTAAAAAREGHDFVFTDRYCAVRPAYDSAVPAQYAAGTARTNGCPVTHG